MHTKKTNFTNNQGVTIVELTIVLIILAILSIGVYRMWSTTPITLSSLTNVLAADIRYTKTLSMTMHSRYRINLTGSTQYTILDGTGTALTIPSTNNSNVATFPTGVTMSASTSTYLVFDSKGTPYLSSTANGSGTLMTSTLTVTLTSGSNNKQITITPETGKVSIL